MRIGLADQHADAPAVANDHRTDLEQFQAQVMDAHARQCGALEMIA